jgi:hypothetical protein
MIVYRAVPYLVVVAPPVIVLLSVLVGGCTMTRPVDELIDQARFHSGPNSRAGEELIMELDRRAAREELRRIIGEAQR